MVEEWRPWPKNRDYAVSSLGNVLSKFGNLLKGRPNGQGYMRVQVEVAGRLVDQYVHRLVCETFIGPAPAGHHADHINSHRGDNRIENLRWLSPEMNRAARKFPRGKARSNTKLSDDEVRQIRAAHGSHRQVAIAFNISREHARDIRNGKERIYVD